MKRNSLLLCCGAAAALLCVAGCQTGAENAIPSIAVSRAQSPITLDGELTEDAWGRTPGHVTALCSTELLPLEEPDRFEVAEAKVLYDDEYLYVGCTLKDSDVFNEYTRNQTHLYRGGDVLEIFLYPVDSKPNCYWELYASPNGLRTNFFFPDRGLRELGSNLKEDEKLLMPGFAVKAKVNGSLNDHTDVDAGWTAEMRVPLKELEKCSGVKFAPGSKWRILVARYNYGCGLCRKQHSSFPPLPRTNFHLLEYYAPVEFR